VYEINDIAYLVLLFLPVPAFFFIVGELLAGFDGVTLFFFAASAIFFLKPPVFSDSGCITCEGGMI
jgi:hypothetical protein